MKAYVVAVVLLCALSLTAAYRIEAGEIECGNATSWTDIPSDDPNKDNTREAVRIVTFSGQFCRPPTIRLSVTYLDAFWNKNLRYEARLKSVTETQATISCFTWHDTEIFNMKISYLVIAD